MIESIILGLTQGLTEFLPISSSGHLIIIREALELSVENSLNFDIFLNTATLITVIYCFWGDLSRIVVDFFSQGFSRRSTNIILSVIVGTIPAFFIGFKYSSAIEYSLRSVSATIFGLLIGSIFMFWGDRFNFKNKETVGIKPLKALIIGIFQSFAFLPGVSRSGASISGGLLSKLSREEAIKFSFLLYIPISLGAAAKSFLDLSSSQFGLGINEFFNLYSIVAFFTALLSGIWAVKFMMRYVSRNSFTPFIIYRIILAIALLVFLQ